MPYPLIDFQLFTILRPRRTGSTPEWEFVGKLVGENDLVGKVLELWAQPDGSSVAYRIGRQSAHLVIPYNNVSRQHCEVIVSLHSVPVLRDKGSLNGTYVNRDRISPSRRTESLELFHNDLITLANPGLDLRYHKY